MSALPNDLRTFALNDSDSQETREWMDALSAVIHAPRPGSRSDQSAATWPSGPSASRIRPVRGADPPDRMQRRSELSLPLS